MHLELSITKEQFVFSLLQYQINDIFKYVRLFLAQYKHKSLRLFLYILYKEQG